MKRKNINKHLKRLHEITGYTVSELDKLLLLLDNNMYKLVEIIEIILNNKYNTSYTPFPISPKEVIKIMEMENNKIYADFTNFFNATKPIYMYWDNNPMSKKPILKNNNVKLLNKKSYRDSNNNIKMDKKSKKQYHADCYPSDYKPKKKEKSIRKKKNNWNKKKKSEKIHTSQSKLVCIHITDEKHKDFNKIIRIRQNNIVEKTLKKGIKLWNYTTKTEFKKQEGKYKIKDLPIKGKPNKLIKINLLRAFFIKKDEIIELPKIKKIKSRIIEIIKKGTGRIKYKTIIEYEKEPKYHISESRNKKVWKTKNATKTINIKRKIKGEIIETTKKKKFKKLVKKEIVTIKGKVTEIKIPIFTNATKYTKSIKNIANSKYNIRQNCRIKKENGKVIPKIIKL